MQKDLIELRDTEQTLLRNISKNYKNSGSNSNSIIYYGVVEEIDRIGNDSRPRYSILVRLLNIDPIDPNFKAFRWYSPLFPIHLSVIPEINEKVKIIMENPTDLSIGYWISRDDTQNKLTRTLVGEDLIDTPNESFASKYGIEEDISKRKDTDIEPDHEYNIPINRDKPGDIVLSGRSNTEIRQSFDSESKKGYIELSTEKQDVNDSEFYSEDFVNLDGSRIILSTKSDLDKKIIYNFTIIFKTKI